MRLIERAEPLPVIPVALRPVRAPGLHISEVIHDLCVTLYPERFSGTGDMDTEFVTELEEVPVIYLGMAWEERLERTLDAQHPCSFRPGEMQHRGIYMNADRLAWEGPRAGLDPDDIGDAPIVEEHKLTRMSGNHDIEGPKFTHWLYQLMWYCAGFKTRRGRIRAFFVNADYRFGQTPAADPRARNYRVWDALFSQQELDDNEQMLVQHARIARKKGRL